MFSCLQIFFLLCFIAIFAFFNFNKKKKKERRANRNRSIPRHPFIPSYFLHMEFSSIWYFSLCSLVSLVFSTTGIYALRRAFIPVSDLVELGIVSSVSCSATYAFLFRPLLEHDHKLETSLSNKIFLHFYGDFATVHSPLIVLAVSAYYTSSGHRWDTGMAVWMLFCVLLWLTQASQSITMGFKYSQAIGNFFTGFAGPLRMYPHHSLCWLLIQGLVLSALSVLKSASLWDSYLNLILTSASIPSSLLLFASKLKKLEGSSSMAAYAYKNKKIIEIILGCLGTTLAQYYFKAKSVPLMLSFLSFAIAWLGNLANVQPCTDFGIFHFLVTASLECAVSLFGLHLHTFIVVMAGIFLMVLRWKIMEFEFVSLRYDGVQESVLKDWNRLEELYGGNDSTLQTQQLEQPSNIG